MANILFAKSFAEHMSGIGASQVTAVSLHPGVIGTSLWKEIPSFIMWFLPSFIFDKTIPQGAATTVFACVSPRVAQADYRGAYLSDCDVKLPSGDATSVSVRYVAYEQCCM